MIVRGMWVVIADGSSIAEQQYWPSIYTKVPPLSTGRLCPPRSPLLLFRQTAYVMEFIIDGNNGRRKLEIPSTCRLSAAPMPVRIRAPLVFSKFTKSIFAVSLILVPFFYKRTITKSFLEIEPPAGVGEQSFLPPETSSRRPKGVFVFKVSNTMKLEKTLCTLNVFFNEKERYPIRIFTDHLSETDDTITKFTGNADVKIILNERWRELPPSLTTKEKEKVLANCQDFNDPERARCSSRKVTLGYIFNTYW